jgi:hypothetical protein
VLTDDVVYVGRVGATGELVVLLSLPGPPGLSTDVVTEDVVYVGSVGATGELEVVSGPPG